ncbi:MAG: molybdopterin-dependent oxidoreductase [Anaerolinea sp.]|nr:molybdopterin-dependent oxidoreductase [Anaerolinea sp.]
MMHKPSPLTGGLIGGLLSLPLIVIAALAQQFAGFSFFPFDTFDWVARTLPGPLITFGIDSMVAVIRGLNLGRTDTTAKLAEQSMAILLVIVVAVIAGALFFVLMNALAKRRTNGTAGAILGLIAGLPFAALSFGALSAFDPLIGAGWTLLLWIIWGVIVGEIYERFAYSGAVAQAESSATPVSATAIDRRQFLVQLGAATATITVVGAGVSTLLNGTGNANSASEISPAATLDPETAANLPVSRGDFSPAPGTRPEITPLAQHYRIDIRATPLDIPAEGYTLPFTTQIGGAATIAALTLDDIRSNYEPVDAYITMSCISNPVGGDLISTTKWTGVSMQDILASMEVPEGATYLNIKGGDGFDETLALDMIANDERIMLTYAWDDQPLLPKHGFPLRIHIPNHYGMKQPKWITEIQFIEEDQDGYWVRRGWDKQAIVRATSVIDTVRAADSDATAEPGAQPLVAIGGIAWAGDRGIAGVQVRIDGGDWQNATVNAPISDRTWQLWRYDWAFTEGYHTFEVRCIETDGTMQIESNEPTRPSGATGIHSVSETL